MHTANVSEKLVKSYSDRNYKYTQMVTHKGTLIAFAMDDQRHIFYTILDLNDTKDGKEEFDVAYWSDNPFELQFPNEIEQVGYSLVGSDRMPVVKLDTRTEAVNPGTLLPEEIDLFLSTTARLTADAPFQVLSDNQHIFLFRQAITDDHQDSVCKLKNGAVSGDSSRPDSDFLLDDGNKLPIVNRTLLCDRFALSGKHLRPNREVRYQRSRHKTRPANQTDSLAAKDMEGNPFFEPTQELAFVRNLRHGSFTILQLPTQVQGIKRWQLFANNSSTERIDTFNFEVSDDGLFNVQGTQLYTSPDKQYQSAVLERSPGSCPFTGLPLVPFAQNTNYAETALNLDGSNYMKVALEQAWQPTAFTLEAWVRSARQNLAAWTGIFSSSDSAGEGSFQIDCDGSGKYRFLSGNTNLILAPITTDWQHLAVTYDGTTFKAFLNGEEVQSREQSLSFEFSHFLIGRNRGGNGLFEGQIDEVRVWNRGRSQYEIESQRSRRLVGNELGLVGYWRFDEGSGTTVFDQTDNGHDGTTYGNPQWVASDAPVADHPEMRRSSFTFSERSLVGGLSAKLYYQQEEIVGGYDATPKPMKKNARVMLAAATTQIDGTDPATATLDFAVSKVGRLAQVPDNIDLPILEKPQASHDVTTISSLEGDIRNLTDDIEQLNQEIDIIQVDVARIPAETSLKQTIETIYASLIDQQTEAVEDFRNYWCRLKLTSNNKYLVVEPSNDSWIYMTPDGSGEGNRLYWRFDSQSNGEYYIYNKGRAGILVSGDPCRLLPNRTDGTRLHIVSNNQIRLGRGSKYWYSRTWDTYGGLNAASDNTSLLEVIKGPVYNHVIFDTLTSMIGSKQVELDNQIALVDYLNTRQIALVQKEALRLQKQTARTQKQDQVSLLTAGEKQDIRLPMGFVHLDASGLMVKGSLMKFATATQTPTILDGATGELSLYYPDVSNQFMVAYCQTLVARNRLLFLESGITFLPRAVGSQNITATISDGSHDDTCTLVITNSDLNITETWNNLPRDPKQFTDILNGQGDRPDTVTATVTPAIFSVKEHSLQIISTVINADATILNGNPTALLGQDSRWSADAPGRAYYFNSNSALLTLPDTQVVETATASNLTVEAWANMSRTNNDTVRLLHHCSSDVAYTLALQEDTILQQPALNFDGSGDCVIVSPHPKTATAAITVSLWAKSNTDNWNTPACLVTKRDAYVMHPDSGKTISFRVYLPDNSWKAVRYTPLEITEWHHYAGTFDGTTLKLYIDGVEVASANVSDTPQNINADDGRSLYIGKDDYFEDRFFNGRIDEVRIWNKARSASEIQADLDRRLNGNELGLAAYYTFHNGEARDKGPGGYHGTIHGNPTAVETCTYLAPKNYHLVAGVSYGTQANHNGQRFLKSRETLPAEQWHHVALRFNQSYGLQFNGKSHLNCGNSQMLDIGEDLTIEAFVQLNDFNATQGIIGKGFLGKDEQSVPYQLKVGPDIQYELIVGSLANQLATRHLEFTFEDADGGRHTFRSNSGLTPGKFHRIAVTRKKCFTQIQETGPSTTTYKDDKNVETTVTVQAIKSVEMEEWFEITFYIDGVQCGINRYEGEAPLGNDEALEIGRTQTSPRDQQYTQGIISEIRLWNTARKQENIGTRIVGKEPGLVSWWQLEDNEGNIATDSNGSNHGKVKGAQWVKNPDPKGGVFNLLWNGLPMAADPMTDGTPSWGDPQFSLAGYSNGSAGDRFKGILEEVRIWRVIRTEEQITDNLFTRLKGEKQDLLAYYTFDILSNESQSNHLNDNGLRGNHLPLAESDADRPMIVLSTAPISNDTAAVRSALSGVDTAFHERIDSTPAVQEYADLQRDIHGNMGGVLKRCYSYLQEGQWHLVTGYKVGNLVTEWIGQAQFSPQVIGYIEGVPPVPSENLTGGVVSSRYDVIEDISNIEFIESETVNYALSSSKDKSFDMGFKASGKMKATGKVSMVAAPLGVGSSQEIVDVDVTVGLQGNFDTSNQWGQEESLGTSINRTRSMSVALGGSLEGAEEGQQRNPAVGRRVVPGNMGFALVQSQTADIFALRLAHNNALVSFRMMPNPDIPIDWNIIPFQINPFYTKQGTLDGRIGYDENGSVVLDESYANANSYGEYSYFKPKETYAIEKRIEREEQRLLNYYQNFDTAIANTGQVIGAAAGAAASIMVAGPVGAAMAGIGAGVGGLAEAVSSDTSLTLPKKFAKRNIVNTYVWTADGGFFAETTETTDVKSEVTAGAFTFSGEVGGTFGLEIKSPVGLSMEFEAALGGSINVTKTRAKETEKAFSLAVNVDVPGDLQKTAPDVDNEWKPVFDEDGSAVTAAGKVDAYRFKTFYLDSSERNFEDLFGKVIDPIWLEGDSPNAAALRQANQSNSKPPCWRIFHRVTFVSRILPEFPDTTAAPLESALKAENIDSNWQLIQKLDPFVRNHTQDSIVFIDAVRKAIKLYLPELEPHTIEIIKYLKLYYAIS